MKALGVGNYFTATRLSGNERYGSRVIEAYLSKMCIRDSL